MDQCQLSQALNVNKKQRNITQKRTRKETKNKNRNNKRNTFYLLLILLKQEAHLLSEEVPKSYLSLLHTYWSRECGNYCLAFTRLKSNTKFVFNTPTLHPIFSGTSFFLSTWVTFLPEGVVLGFWNFACGFNSQKK